jgi:hypothetical protein
MQDFMKFFISACLFAISSAAHAGGWASGGGELHRDERNPWFLSNTSTVTYCVSIDEEHFGTTREKAEVAVTTALAYWKAEIGSVEHGHSDVGTQTFVRQASCSNDVDVAFQFGVLTPDQKEHIGDTSRFAALSVRTDYDLVKLRGKGFVYVSPETGDLAPVSLDLLAEHWQRSDGKLLALTLMHELGHVFGLIHSGSDDDLMGEGYVERILSKDQFAYFLAQPIPHVLTLGTFVYGEDCRWGGYGYDGQLNDFFGIEITWSCRKMELTENSLTIFAKPTSSTPGWTRVGTAALDQVGAWAEIDMPFKAYVTNEAGWMTSGQQNLQPMIATKTQTGIYRSDDGRVVREVSAYLHPSHPRLWGVRDGHSVASLFLPYSFPFVAPIVNQ